jgi:GxxExxY protein
MLKSSTGIAVAMPPDMIDVQRHPVTSVVLAAAIEVHRCLGPGMLEGVYQTCLFHELVQQGIEVESQVAVPVIYKGVQLDCGFRLDLLVAQAVIIEVKSVDQLLPVHSAQVLTYLRLTGAQQALLLNFNAPALRDGLKSFLGKRAESSL